MLKVRHTDDEAIEVGIDEAGRGCLWGPLYAGAVIWVDEKNMNEEQKKLSAVIKDSKKLTPKRRTAMAAAIQELAVAWSVGSVSPSEIDTLGVTKANQLAFTRALEGLDIEPDRLLIDGCLSILDAPWSFVEQIVEPEADNRYIAVAAASILAKTAHDEWVSEFCDTNENIAATYDLASNKGYGTAKHRAAIVEHGATSLHRQLFLRKLFAGHATNGDSYLEHSSGQDME